METEYNNFVQQLSDFVNQEVTQFRCRLMLLDGTSQNIQNTSIQVHEVAQAMSERVDKVEQEMESVCFGQKEEVDWALQYGIFGLKIVILCEVDQEIVVLETRLEVKINEAHQTTATRLQDIKDSVMAIRESQ